MISILIEDKRAKYDLQNNMFLENTILAPSGQYTNMKGNDMMVIIHAHL